MTDNALRERLDALERSYGRDFLPSDPVEHVRRYDDPDDREVVGLLAAGLAYGRVASIRASLDALLPRLGKRPGRFVDAFDLHRDRRRFDGFVHRFNRGRDVAILLSRLRKAREQAGSLESFFLSGDDPESPTLETAMTRFGQRLLTGLPRDDRARWFLPLPVDRSVCKRHCLFLRWMVRPDDGVDCGAWLRVSPARLVLPLDTHLQRIARALGWTRRKTPCWAMALEVTERLRRLDPDDPTRYDFALSRLGILGLLRAKRGRLRRAHVAAVLREVG